MLAVFLFFQRLGALRVYYILPFHKGQYKVQNSMVYELTCDSNVSQDYTIHEVFDYLQYAKTEGVGLGGLVILNDVSVDGKTGQWEGLGTRHSLVHELHLP